MKEFTISSMPRKLSTSKVCVKDAELLQRQRECAGQQEVKKREEVGKCREIQERENFKKKGGVSRVKC